MKKIIMSVLAIGLLTITACNHTQKAVPHTVASGYFVKNTYQDGQLKNPKITTRETFEAYFGMAATMDGNGMPTPIDFDAQYVIAVIGPESDRIPELEVVSLTQESDSITLEYRLNEKQEPASFTSKPVLLLVVDKTHEGEVMIEQVE
ncbi:hypothetical protein [Parapedobacter tibetensis]|uniref:hypothetical protein n=1 Tax=Parapedobacter tibetensis TaxID=2972951 RepID=UPI00214DEF07|nr:hypothetical protein [Parapedobacter tibetensis]